MLLDDLASCVDANCPESVITRQFHLRLQPELGFIAGMLHMDVWARFFARAEVEPVPANTEASGTHGSRISDSLHREFLRPIADTSPAVRLTTALAFRRGGP